MHVIEGRAFVQGQLIECGIGVEGGVVTRVAKVLKGDERTRFPGALILPGAADLHVHFRDPGAPQKEDFASGTTAAACGGVTTVADMPNTDPPTDSPERAKEKLEGIRRKAHVDHVLYGGLREGVDAAGMAPHVAAFKLYMAPSTGELQIQDYGALPDLLQAASEAGRPVSVHGEHVGRFHRRRGTDLETYGESRPPEAEKAAIELLRKVRGDARVHVAHLSSRLSLPRVGGGLTSEVTPHHLLLTAKDALGALGKVNPPLRGDSDRAALWKALRAGGIDVVASDHAPHTREEKEDFASAPPGMPGVETMLPLLFAAVRRRRLSLRRMVSALCERPAEILGLEKGRIAVGRDADLVVLHPHEESRIREDDLHSRSGWSAFEGRIAFFPQAVFLRGERVVEGRELKIERRGRHLPPES